jgi:hypothetical protein
MLSLTALSTSAIRPEIGPIREGPSGGRGDRTHLGHLRIPPHISHPLTQKRRNFLQKHAEIISTHPLFFFSIMYSSYITFPHSERSLWENGFFENSPKIVFVKVSAQWEKLMGKRVFWKFAKNQIFVGRKRFLDRGFLDLRFIAYIFSVFFLSRERPF